MIAGRCGGTEFPATDPLPLLLVAAFVDSHVFGCTFCECPRVRARSACQSFSELTARFALMATIVAKLLRLFKTAPAAPVFDVVATSRALLATPDISARLQMPQLVAAWLGVFFAVDGMFFLLLRSALPSGAAWETRVKIRNALVSSVHDLITIPLVCMLLAGVSHMADGPGGLLGIGPLAHIPMALIDRAGTVFIGFLLWDCVHTLTHSAPHSIWQPPRAWPRGLTRASAPPRAQRARTARGSSRTCCTTSPSC